jgi:hypothetical protein
MAKKTKKTKKTNEELIELAKEYVHKAENDAKENPTSEMIQVVVVEPNKKPYKMEIENTLESMQEIVKGYIEIVPFGKTEKGGSLAITLNEEGKLVNLPMNRIIVGRGGSDILVGTFFITAYNMQGDNISLKDIECEHLIKRFRGLEVYL